MRTRIDTGFVKWVKAFKIKAFIIDNIFINFILTTENEIAWITLSISSTPYIYRISSNGTILQVICFGANNLSFSTKRFDCLYVSESEFLAYFTLSETNENLAVSQTSGTDASLVRISTDLSIKYNLMIDFANGVDALQNALIINDVCYILVFSVFNGYIFTNFPIERSQIDIEIMKQNSLRLEDSFYSTSLSFYYCTYLHNDNNFNSDYNSILMIVCQTKENQSKIMNFNLTESMFKSTTVIDFNISFFPSVFVPYNSTLIYVWGGTTTPKDRQFIIAFDTLTKNSRKYYLKYERVVWIAFYKGSIYSQYTDIAFGEFSIMKTNMNFESDCYSYNLMISEEDPKLLSLNLTAITVVIYDSFLNVFNITQTLFPVYDKYVTELFWPQTRMFGESTICQPSELIPASTILNWMLSESNQNFTVIPFTNCQGIPVNITSIETSNIAISLITNNGDSITINSGFDDSNPLRQLDLSGAPSKVYPNQTIVVTISAATNTFIQMPMMSSFAINIFNSSPKLSVQTHLIKVKISDGLNLGVVYSNFCSYNSTSLTLSDDEGDTVYIIIDFNDNNPNHGLIVLNEHKCTFDLFINTSDYLPGNYSMKITFWDMFHKLNYVEDTVDLNVLYMVPPEFTSSLPDTLKTQMCIETKYNLPMIFDRDEDYSHININFTKDWIKIQNTTLTLNPNLVEPYPMKLEIELIDRENLSSKYSINVIVVNDFKYIPNPISRIKVSYPKPKIVDISELLYQFNINQISISLEENGQKVSWAQYNYDKMTIIFSNIAKQEYGDHILKILIYNSCFKRFFEVYSVVEIYPYNPPTVIGTISNMTAYQGQDKIILTMQNDIFYDKDDVFSIIINSCDDVLVNIDTSLKNISTSNPFSIFDLKFNKNFVGNCSSSLIAVDSLLQTASINFNVDVLKCPQDHCIYCNGPNTTDCTQCVSGYIINSSNGKCVAAYEYYDRWVIVIFIIIVFLMTFFTDHDLNASYVLLESLTFYWIIFYAFKNKSSYISQYFEQLTIITSHLNSLLVPVYNYFEITKNDEQITYSFVLNCATIIIVICIYIVYSCFNHESENTNSQIENSLSKFFSRYIHWSSTYLWFCLFIEIFSISNLQSLRLLSYITACVFILIAAIFSYCVVFYSSQECLVCNRINIIKKIRIKAIFYDKLKRVDYFLILRYTAVIFAKELT